MARDPTGIDEDGWAVPQQRSLTEVAAGRIVDAIRNGELKPGERIVESQLASRMRISRGPLREALKKLEANNLVESRRGKGTFVAQISTIDIERMITLRAQLEGLAARLAAASATDQQIEALTALHDRIVSTARAGQTREWRELDWSFHELVCRTSGNGFLLAAWRSISTLVRVFLHQFPDFDRNMESVLENHTAFIEAIRSRNPDRAEAVFRSAILKSGFAHQPGGVPDELRSYLEGASGSSDPSARPSPRSDARRHREPRKRGRAA